VIWIAAESALTTDAFPVVGKATTIHVPDGVEALEVTYQPDAPIATMERVPVSGTEAVWTPAKPGIAKIQVVQPDGKGEAIERSVKFDGVPVSGVVICLVAATVLIGGAAWATRMLLHLDGDEE